MYKRVRKNTFPGLWILLCLCVIPAARAATISLTPSFQSIAPGQNFAMTLEVAGAGQLVTGYDVTIGFDPTLVAFDTRTFANALGIPVLDTFPSLIVLPDSVTIGEIALISDALIPPQGDPLALFTIQFTALGPGLANFSLTASSPFSGETPFGEPFPNAIEIEAANGASVNIASVPEPETLLLVVSGLAALLFLRRNVKTPDVP